MFRLTGLSDIDFNQLFNLAPNPYVIIDRDFRIVGMNDAYLLVTGRGREELVGQDLFEAFPSHPDSVHGRMLRQSFDKVFQSGTVDHLPLIAYPIPDGEGGVTERYWSATNTPILVEGDAVRFVLQHTVDVTELQRHRQSAEDGLKVQTDLWRRADAVQGENRALEAEREFLRTLFEQAPGFAAVLREPEHIFSIANKAYLDLIGRDDVIGRSVRDALPEIAGQGFYELLDDVYRSGVPYSASSAKVLLQRSPEDKPEERYLDFIYQPIRNAAGEVNGIFVQGHDVTGLRWARQAAHENEERFKTLAQSLPNQVWTATPDGHVEWLNDEIHRYSGRSGIYFGPVRRSTILHPEDVDRVQSVWERSLQTGETFEAEMRIRRYDGAYRWFLTRAVPVRRPEGGIALWVATNTDIDEQKRNETHLESLATTLGNRVEERTIELERTQAILRQSQKMEAIGNLAGGIAHDFNNLLQVIGGNLQLLRREFDGNEVAMKRLDSALAGASRGARLASQLLSFGRRQPLAPKVINLSRLIGEMDHLLRRSLGDAIEIDTVVGPELWNTLVDPSNVENALLNLAINARDAMDGRGKLTIELGNAVLDDQYASDEFDVEAGQYVMLAVSDTGSGMTPETLAKAFDPFFTTKPEGRGTGLGLSMVYGFVKQSGGHIRIYSEPGSGTTIRIYLPRSLSDEEDPSLEDNSMPIAGGQESILVVEDDDGVRDITVSLLTELGYRVLKARDAESGLAIIESGVSVDVLFTDVVMPGALKSSDLATKAKERIPHLAVLFTSGYTENSIVHGGRLDPGVSLLSKPYTREALARKIRSVIEQTGSERSRAAAVPEETKPAACTPTAAKSIPGPDATELTDDDAQDPAVLRVLLVEDEALIRISTADYLQDTGMTVIEAGSAQEALAEVDENGFDILVTDVHLPDMSGLQLTLAVREKWPGVPVIFATGDRDVPGSEVLANKDLIVKPYDYDLLARKIRSMVGR
jgi:PAS domain S-box-containing protein